MNERDAATWRDANREVVLASIAEMKARAAAVAAGRQPDTDGDVETALGRRGVATAATGGTDSISILADGFGLTPFETELLVLAAAVELDAELRRACVDLAGRDAGATFALATRLLDGSHWSSIGPGRPLRGAALVELGPGPLPEASITVAERVLHHVMGCGQLDAELARTAIVLPPGAAMTPAQQALSDQVVAAWSDQRAPIVQLAGRRPADGRDIAAVAAATVGAVAYRVRTSDLPHEPSARADAAKRWRREMVLAATVLVVESADEHPSGDVAGFLDHLRGPVAVIGGGVIPTVVPLQRIEVPAPARDEARDLWRAHLGAKGRALRVHVDRAAEQFRLGAGEIAEIAADVVAANGSAARALWDGCRRRTRPALDGLVERVVSAATWEDLVLPEAELTTLRAIVSHAEQRAAVARSWGTPAGGRGTAITALFCGPSGTGKTLAGEVVANALGLDLYRIDLSAVVSKWIGETEKNLRAIFDAAEDGGAVLLFDEADALFGKRTEVRDSHDRYANIEVSYLLQRMETYRGLAILTTNVRSAIDSAFLRRLRFVVTFPFPDAAQRAEIWRRVFPRGVRTAGLEPTRLAGLGVSGATIEGIARHAAHEAAADATPVGVAHIQRAAQRELAKLDRPLTASELRGLQ